VTWKRTCSRGLVFAVMIAYLVIREGSKWTDVFRLTPGRTVTIGRATTNQIVIKDERCSRHHAELFHAGGFWTVRDLSSRNGTLVAERAIEGDRVLVPGEIMRIADCQLAFVTDLSHAFADSGFATVNEETVSGPRILTLSDSHVLESPEAKESPESTVITHRRVHTRLLERPEGADSAPPKLGHAATQLCRLAFELANQTRIVSAAQLALDGLFEGIQVDAGAVLLASSDGDEPLKPERLEVVASRTNTQSAYRGVSSFLAEMVIRDGEAVLARNVEDDSSLGICDSQGVSLASSVICAPIRRDARVVGLIHLYVTQPDRAFDADDLEFTLAVADNVALALKHLGREQELTANLTATRSELVQLRKQLGAESEIIGSSKVMRTVQEEIARAAPSRATILIRGESGVGKELVARAVHYASPRKKGPFVCLNCAALSETLLESELFGHERGAFTGATDRKVGKFEAADQGTLMLDEIGEMSPSIQSKFLRVLEGHPFERVGGSKAIRVDVRVIAATNRDLEKAVADGTFRRDLYFRLHVVEIKVPPLRKRPQDVLTLAEYFLAKFSQETGRRIQRFTPAARDALIRYRWPGNVRELRNVIERAVLLANQEQLGPEDLVLSNLSTASESGEYAFPPTNSFEPLPLAEVEKRHIAATLQSTSWNKSRAAELLGIERTTLDRKIQRYDLKPAR
jgi:transcriptional regulator with GAF, ATPase, and Fis domain